MQKNIANLLKNYHRNIIRTKNCLKIMDLNVLQMCTASAGEEGSNLPATTKSAPLSMRVRQNPVVTKINTPEFNSIFTDELRALIDLFNKYNYELRIAGGAVRDILMNIEPKDVDLATTATPDEMKAMFANEKVRMVNTKGEKHGTITPRINNKENFEVTTLRVDVVTDGRHAEVQFTTDWEKDANRRDLTINSMFLGFDGTVYDYFYGYDDLQNRRVMFVGNPDARIKEDFLRILRYFRFYGRIATTASDHDEHTLTAIENNADGLSKISGERIWSELRQLLQGNFAKELITDMLKCGLTKHMGFPSRSINQKEFQELFIRVEPFSKPHHPILFVSALLNHIEEAMALNERLKLSAYERDLMLFIIQNRSSVGKSLNELRDYQVMCLQPAVRRDYVQELLKYSGNVEVYNTLESWKTPPFPINGNMLKERNYKPGKLMGDIMLRLKIIWAKNNFETSAADLLDIHLPKVLQELQPPKAIKAQKVKKLKLDLMQTKI